MLTGVDWTAAASVWTSTAVCSRAMSGAYNAIHVLVAQKGKLKVYIINTNPASQFATLDKINHGVGLGGSSYAERGRWVYHRLTHTHIMVTRLSDFMCNAYGIPCHRSPGVDVPLLCWVKATDHRVLM